MKHFQMIDAPERPQALAIHWEMKTPRDDYASAPDKMQDGYWPSLDPKSDGYIGEGYTPADLKKFTAKARLRYNRWLGDAWHYVGVVAVAHVFIPVGGRSFRVLTLESAGLWGIESDAGKDHLRDTFTQERRGLMAELETMAKAISGGVFAEEGPEFD